MIKRMEHIEVIDERLLEGVSAEARKTSRLRMNHNFHKSLDDKCHRFVNAVEPGSEIPIHHHPTKDEAVVVLKGKVKVMTYDDGGQLLDCVILSHDDGVYGVNIPRNVWHTIESLEPGTVLFECKEGPFVPHEQEGVMEKDLRSSRE